jgi:formylglycine-generating enzyme required for sulfatase activity
MEIDETAKQVFTVKGVSFTMIPVQGGTFQMGATSEQVNPNNWEKPVHTVTLSNYYIGETEVTQALWKAVMGSNPSMLQIANHPVDKVSWKDCQIFIQRLNALTGKKFRLPTEAEWEYAARGGRESKGYQYSGSNDLREVAWFMDNAYDCIHDVKTKAPNELGIYDMSGNVNEWCQDRYTPYSSSAETNPKGGTGGSDRIIRGGDSGSKVYRCRTAYRSFEDPSSRYLKNGFRLAL